MVFGNDQSNGVI